MKTIVTSILAVTFLGIDSPAAPEATPIPATPAPAPFRLIFKLYEEPQKLGPFLGLNFQIETVDFRQPTKFLKIGEMIPHTPFRLMQFTYKEQYNPRINDKADASELTLKNVNTGETVVLIYNQVINTTAQPLK